MVVSFQRGKTVSFFFFISEIEKWVSMPSGFDLFFAWRSNVSARSVVKVLSSLRAARLVEIVTSKPCLPQRLQLTNHQAGQGYRRPSLAFGRLVVFQVLAPTEAQWPPLIIDLTYTIFSIRFLSLSLPVSPQSSKTTLRVTWANFKSQQVLYLLIYLKLWGYHWCNILPRVSSEIGSI